MLSESTSRKLQLVIALPTIVLLLVQHDLNFVVEFFLLVPALCAVAAAWFLALDASLAAIRRRPARHLWSALVLAACLGPAFPFVNVPFCWAAAVHKLWRSEARYAELVHRADAGEDVDGFYVTEDGPPRLYSFLWGGIADNWYGVVHDASRTFDRAGEDVLGGDLVFEMHLWGPWYFVQFT